MKYLTNNTEGFHPHEVNSGSMPGIKIVPDEYLALHSTEVISSIIVTPRAPHHPWLIVGTNTGDILFYLADVNHTDETRTIVRQKAHDISPSPIEAIACGNLTGAFSIEIVTVCADGQLTTFTPPINDGDHPYVNHTQLIQANVKAAHVMDVDGDGIQELVVILTDRVVRTYRFSHSPENRLLPINKWEVPCQITGYAISPLNPLTSSADLVLSQMGNSYYINIPLSGGDKVDLTYQINSKLPAIMMLPQKIRFAGIMGSMMEYLALRGKPTDPRDRQFENTGFPLITVCACIANDGMELIATIDIRGMVLLYASPGKIQEETTLIANKSQADIEAVAYFETDESCEYTVMTVVDDNTVMMSVANIFRHLFLYKLNLTEIQSAVKQRQSKR